MNNYWLNNYGACKLESPNCICLKKGWKGQYCPHWKPLGAKTLEELKKIIYNEHSKK
jgi:hypothetical protein